MKYLKEVTEWECGYRVPQHTYILDKNVLVGYIKEGTNEKIFFKSPSKQWSKKGRKFKEIKGL
jgi:hypothetical protein